MGVVHVAVISPTRKEELECPDFLDTNTPFASLGLACLTSHNPAICGDNCNNVHFMLFMAG